MKPRLVASPFRKGRRWPFPGLNHHGELCGPRQRQRIVMFTWEITRTEESGAEPLRGNTLLVAAKQNGRWIIIAGQAAAVPLPK
jgi:hypothetical protein